MCLSPREQNWLKQLETLVLLNLANSNYDIPQLAYDMSLCERQLRRKIKKLTGCNPLDYVKRTRLQQAQFYIKQGRYQTITAIAQAVGFKSADTFSRNFSKHFGKSPSSFIES